MSADPGAERAPRLTLRVVRDPEPRTVPHVAYPDGTVSESWEDWHREAAQQRPDLYDRPRTGVPYPSSD